MEEEKELWKDVVGYEGRYQVSNMGRVKSLERKVWNGRGYGTVSEKILKPRKNKYGYLDVLLHRDGKAKRYRVNRLVASAFIPNPQGLPEVNHINEDKTDNSLENLAWVTHKENINHGTRTERQAEKLRGKKQTEEHVRKRSKPIMAIDKISGLIVEFSSSMEAERVLGINHSNITQCCKGRYKTVGGFQWFYSSQDTTDDTDTTNKTE